MNTRISSRPAPTSAPVEAQRLSGARRFFTTRVQIAAAAKPSRAGSESNGCAARLLRCMRAPQRPDRFEQRRPSDCFRDVANLSVSCRVTGSRPNQSSALHRPQPSGDDRRRASPLSTVAASLPFAMHRGVAIGIARIDSFRPAEFAVGKQPRPCRRAAFSGGPARLKTQVRAISRKPGRNGTDAADRRWSRIRRSEAMTCPAPRAAARPGCDPSCPAGTR